MVNLFNETKVIPALYLMFWPGRFVPSIVRFVILTPGHVAPAEVAPVPRVARRVARRDCLGPGTGPVVGVVSARLHRQGPWADDVRLPEVVGGGVEGLGGRPGLLGRL